MGYSVVSFCNIDITKGKIEVMPHIKIKKLLEKAEAFEVTIKDEYISCQLWGNKGVDYEVLEKIKEILQEEKLEFSICSNQYAECGDGYYYNTEEV